MIGYHGYRYYDSKRAAIYIPWHFRRQSYDPCTDSHVSVTRSRSSLLARRYPKHANKCMPLAVTQSPEGKGPLGARVQLPRQLSRNFQLPRQASLRARCTRQIQSQNGGAHVCNNKHAILTTVRDSTTRQGNVYSAFSATEHYVLVVDD